MADRQDGQGQDLGGHGSAVSSGAAASERPWCECDPEYEGRCTDPCAYATALRNFYGDGSGTPEAAERLTPECADDTKTQSLRQGGGRSDG